MSRHPTVLWAQRLDKVFITVELPDAKDVKLKLEPEGKFSFSATAGADNTPYEVELDLFDKVDVNESKSSITSRQICYIVKKAESKWWDKLLKHGVRTPVFLKVDWDKWVDEDELDKKEDNFGSDMHFGGMDFSNLNMGGDGELDDVIENVDYEDDGKDDDFDFHLEYAGDDGSDTEDENEVNKANPAASSELDAKQSASETETKA
ncbi:OLC1v1017566C1 [Oldenlandia corymbosa var. corymbosa]|uniref:Co-chaperone protein p23 n=1 Tax=Oldenlandia corymbosa var. corymbosa TaxID=529605 RepID=A0AAV1E9Y2_OLDCO|nr:OLC1v1017566C1 [Oldenlandia corymbosa var. corymbosa]